MIIKQNTLPREEFRPVVGHQGRYEVSNLGGVRSYRRSCAKAPGPKVLAETDHGGYKVVSILSPGDRVTKKIHRLVAEAFIPNPEGKPCVNHINGNKADNRSSNLEWATYSDNTVHAYALGLRVGMKGSRHGMSKLTETQVIDIRSLPRSITLVEISNRFGISVAMGSLIRNGKHWKHILPAVA